MNRKVFLFLYLSLFSIISNSQIYNPVTWEFGYEGKGGNQYELIFTATIETGSHIYSIDIPEGGPIPTSFSFDTIADFTLSGKTYEVTKPQELFDEAFALKIKTFSKKAEFRQKITANTSDFEAKGIVNFMACDNKRCSPPKDVEFSIKINNPTQSPDISKTTTRSNNPVQTEDLPKTKSDINDSVIGPELTEGSVKIENQVQKSDISEAAVEPASVEKGGLLKFFLLSLLAGFAGVLTPCVFPMIPMTVAFFSRGTESTLR